MAGEVKPPIPLRGDGSRANTLTVPTARHTTAPWASGCGWRNTMSGVGNREGRRRRRSLLACGVLIAAVVLIVPGNGAEAMITKIILLYLEAGGRGARQPRPAL
jgi:hypothetical protein